MKEQGVNDELARRFLLGQLSADQQGQIEELAFADPDTFALLESVEDDLIDEYIHDELSADEKEHFKNHFLTLPGKQSNLRVSRSLQLHFSNAAPELVLTDDKEISVFGLFTISPAALRISLALAALLAGLVIAVWLFIRAREAQRPPQFEAHQEQASPSTPAPKISPTSEPTPQLTQIDKNKSLSPPKLRHDEAVVAVLMPSEGIRGENQPLTLSQKPIVPVELPLINQPAYKSYQATLQSEDGKVLQTWPNLHARELKSGHGLLVKFRRALLKPDELYTITVNGRSNDGTLQHVAGYPFQAQE